ncbi:uncharacterized protein LOC134855357 isoform X3 [Symsagittifera roscoffensis]|uniref:uncharacterized protein LOC134855357 isoform X3 n=1 Tax=Symsagittifera roscoffensis TaxID=84072 RepID=UPI00307BE2C2
MPSGGHRVKRGHNDPLPPADTVYTQSQPPSIPPREPPPLPSRGGSRECLLEDPAATVPGSGSNGTTSGATLTPPKFAPAPRTPPILPPRERDGGSRDGLDMVDGDTRGSRPLPPPPKPEESIPAPLPRDRSRSRLNSVSSSKSTDNFKRLSQNGLSGSGDQIDETDNTIRRRDHDAPNGFAPLDILPPTRPRVRHRSTPGAAELSVTGSINDIPCHDWASVDNFTNNVADRRSVFEPKAEQADNSIPTSNRSSPIATLRPPSERPSSWHVGPGGGPQFNRSNGVEPNARTSQDPDRFLASYMRSLDNNRDTATGSRSSLKSSLKNSNRNSRVEDENEESNEDEFPTLVPSSRPGPDENIYTMPSILRRDSPSISDSVDVPDVPRKRILKTRHPSDGGSDEYNVRKVNTGKVTKKRVRHSSTPQALNPPSPQKLPVPPRGMKSAAELQGSLRILSLLKANNEANSRRSSISALSQEGTTEGGGGVTVSGGSMRSSNSLMPIAQDDEMDEDDDDTSEQVSEMTEIEPEAMGKQDKKDKHDSNNEKSTSELPSATADGQTKERSRNKNKKKPRSRLNSAKELRFGEMQQVEIHYGSFGLYASTTSFIMDLEVGYGYKATTGGVKTMTAPTELQQESILKVSPSKATAKNNKKKSPAKKRGSVSGKSEAGSQGGSSSKRRPGSGSWHLRRSSRDKNEESGNKKKKEKQRKTSNSSKDKMKKSQSNDSIHSIPDVVDSAISTNDNKNDINDPAKDDDADSVSVGFASLRRRPESWRVSLQELNAVVAFSGDGDDDPPPGGSRCSNRSSWAGGETSGSDDELLSQRTRSVLTLVEEFNSKVPELPENSQKHVPWFIRFAASPIMAFAFGPLFGILVYALLAWLVLSGLPLAALFQQGQGSPWTDTAVTQAISGGVGCCAGVFLTIGGHYSSRVRATMVLLVPTLLSKRGRAFMITSAFAILLTGPVHTIEMNIQEVVDSLTCLYEQMRDMAEGFVEQAKENFEQINETMRQVNEAIAEYQREMKELQQQSSDAVQKELEALQKKMEMYQQKLSKVKSFMAKTSSVCDSVVAATTFGFVENCGTPVVPDMPNINLTFNLDGSFSFADPTQLVDIDIKAEAGELRATPITEIRENLKNILRNVFKTIEKYFKYISKICYLSVFFMVADAFHYMYKYYTDDSFDNMFVDQNLKNYAGLQGEAGKTLLPLRNWELLERYQVQTAVKLSKKEYKRIFMQSATTIVFTLFAIGVVVSDIVLRAVLEVFRSEAKFGLEYDGMEQGLSLSTLGKQSPEEQMNITFRMYDLSSEPCLPDPQKSDYTRMFAIAALVTMCLLSCIFDAYATRLRSTVCNTCFPKRAAERAAFLYRRITTGRGTRRLQLQMIAYRRLVRKYREAEFFNFRRKVKAKTKLTDGRSKTSQCVGCTLVINKSEGTKFPLKFLGENATVYICSDCKKDTNLK